MGKITFFVLKSIFVFALFINLATGVSINSGTVLNTSISNSSITFSFNVNVNNFTVESGSVLIYGINFVNQSGTYICNDVNHSIANSSIDSSQFICFLQIPGGSPEGGCGYIWDCTNWNACLPSGKQIRNCFNAGSCSDEYKTPTIEQNCTYIAPTDTTPKIKENKTEINEKESEEKETKNENRIFIYILILFIIIIFIIFYLKKDYFKNRLKI